MTRSQFKTVLAQYPGVTWDADMEDADTLQIDSPKGKRFRANGCHTIVAQFANHGGQSWKPEAYAEVAKTLVAYGLEDCEDDDCDICAEK